MPESVKLFANELYTMRDAIHEYRLAHNAEFLEFVKEEAQKRSAVVTEKPVKRRNSKKKTA